PEAGIPWIRRELTAGGTRGEVVVAQRLGVLLDQWDPDGGLDASAFGEGPMFGRPAALGASGRLAVETPLDPTLHPFLHDHQIDGTPVLPGVMGIEAFAESALSIMPGWRVESVEEIQFLAPFKFYRGEPRTVTVETAFHPREGAIEAECRLIGHRP